MFLFFILLICLVSSKFDGYQYDRDMEYMQGKIYYIKRHHDNMNSHRKFTETNSQLLMLMKDCYPIEIQELINKVTSLYIPYDYENRTESLALNKLFKDLQNYKPFCKALQESMDIYVKKMTWELNMNYFEPEDAKNKRELYQKLGIFNQCNDLLPIIGSKINEEFGSIHSKGMLCLKTIERTAIFHGLKDKTDVERYK